MAEGPHWAGVQPLHETTFDSAEARARWHSRTLVQRATTNLLLDPPAALCEQVRRQRRQPLVPIEVRLTATRGYGCFVAAPVARDALVGEYVGECALVDDWRENGGEASNYAYEVESLGCVVDAKDAGNVLRWINHSCEPSCRDLVLWDGAQWRIVFVAQRDLAAGEELTFDYAMGTYDADDWRLGLSCLCGASNCRGRLYSLLAPEPDTEPGAAAEGEGEADHDGDGDDGNDDDDDDDADEPSTA